MDRAELLQRLPFALAVALRLHEVGAAREVIATALAIEPDSVDALVSVAQAKADRIASDAGEGDPSEAGA